MTLLKSEQSQIQFLLNGLKPQFLITFGQMGFVCCSRPENAARGRHWRRIAVTEQTEQPTLDRGGT